MSNFVDIDNSCTKEKIYSIKKSLNQILIELKKILTKADTVKNIGNKLILINKNIDFLCLQSLGFENPNASYLGNQLRVAAAQMSQAGVIGAAKKCIPYVENLINDLENDYDEGDDEEEDDEEEPSTLFPGHKYLNLSDESEYPEIKAKYRELSLLYHPDKCPNKNTPGMTKLECEKEFIILDSEYKAIKNKFNKTGGKKSKKTNKKTNKKHNSKSKKKVKKTKRRYKK